MSAGSKGQIPTAESVEGVLNTHEVQVKTVEKKTLIRFWGAVASFKGSDPPNFPFSFPFLLVTPVILLRLHQQVAV